MEKFVGPFSFSAGTVIDYEGNNKKVAFDYEKEDESSFYSSFSISFMLIAVPVLAIESILFTQFETTYKIFFTIVLFTALGLPLLLTSSSKFTKEILPKVMYYYQFPLKRKIKIMDLDDVLYESPKFHNIFLQYEATHDFAKFLKQVKTVRHKSLDDNEKYWTAIFLFSKIPKKGYLEVGYI